MPGIGDRMVSGQLLGGGRIVPKSQYGREATVYIDPRGNMRLGEPSATILIHELVGHLHPNNAPSIENPNNAHDINRHYNRMMNVRMRGNYRSPHHGYQPKNMVWPAGSTGLYKK
jgi:hypothetical protein